MLLFKQFINEVNNGSSGQLSFMGYTTQNFDQCPNAYKKFYELIVQNQKENVSSENSELPNDHSHLDMTNVEKQTLVNAGISAKPPHIKAQQFKQYLNL